MNKIDQILESIPEYVNLDSATKVRIRNSCLKHSHIRTSILKETLPYIIIEILLVVFWSIFIMKYARPLMPVSTHAILPLVIFLPVLLLIFRFNKPKPHIFTEDDARAVINNELKGQS